MKKLFYLLLLFLMACVEDQLLNRSENLETVAVSQIGSYIPPTSMSLSTESFSYNGSTYYYGVYKPQGGYTDKPILVSFHGLGWRSDGSNADEALKGAAASRALHDSTAANGVGYGAIVDAWVIIPQAKTSQGESSASQSGYAAIQDFISNSGESIDTTALIVEGMSYGGGTAKQFINRYGDEWDKIAVLDYAGTKGGVSESSVTSTKWDGHSYWYFSSSADNVVSPQNAVDFSTALSNDGEDVQLQIYHGGDVNNHSKVHLATVVASGRIWDYNDSGGTNATTYTRSTGSTTWDPKIAMTVYDPNLQHIWEWAFEKIGYTQFGAGYQVILPGATIATDITLSADSIDENTIGIVGSLSDNGNPSGSYSITGGTNASEFSISGTNLVLDNPQDYETITTLTVEVTVTNSAGSYDESFIININDVAESSGYKEVARVNFGSNSGATGWNDFASLPSGSQEWLSGALLTPSGTTTGVAIRKPDQHVINGYRPTFGGDTDGTVSPASVNKSFFRREMSSGDSLVLYLYNVNATADTLLESGKNYKIDFIIADTRTDPTNVTVYANSSSQSGNAHYTTSDEIEPITVTSQVDSSTEIRLSVDQTTNTSWYSFINGFIVYVEE